MNFSRTAELSVEFGRVSGPVDRDVPGNEWAIQWCMGWLRPASLDGTSCCGLDQSSKNSAQARQTPVITAVYAAQRLN